MNASTSPSLPNAGTETPHSSPARSDGGFGVRTSLLLHLSLLAFVLVKSLVFPSTPIGIIVPTLRVDLVDLPDQRRGEEVKAGEEGLKADPEIAQKETPEAKEKPEESETPDPQEMLTQAKKDAAKKAKAEELERKKKMEDALKKVRALEKIKSELKTETQAGQQLKGNKISKGTSTSGVEATEISYYDLIHSKLQENWLLPVWLSRQNLSAQITLYIDPQGRIKNLRFLKSSGNAQFDDAVKNAVVQSQPFPKPPEDLVQTLSVNGVQAGFPL